MQLTSRLEIKTDIIKDSEDVISRLAMLHPTLDPALFLDANQTGYTSRLEVTPAHAPTAAGSLHWHNFIPALRLALVQRGWSLLNNKNCPLILSPDKKIMIAVMTGDADTGKELGRPKNQGSKGAVLRESINKNSQLQLDVNGGTQLWVLLYHVEQSVQGYKEIRTELSLPASFVSGKISDWTQRILLESIDLTFNPEVKHTLQTDNIDIFVERRAAPI